MCARYYMEESPELRPFVEAMNRSPLMERFPSGARAVLGGEVAPGDVAPVIAPNRKGSPAVFPMRWGFAMGSLVINARSETAAVKPAFADLWAHHRCVVPASWYYEWTHFTEDGKRRTGDRYAIRPREGGIARLCGLYRMEAGVPFFVILTREPGEGIRFIHDRMPLILPEEAAGRWISPDADPGEIAALADTDMAWERAV